MKEGKTTARRFLHSAAAAGISQGVRMLVTLGAMLVLRRTIDAEDWGLFAWAWVVFLVLGALRDLGLAYHVMRLVPRPWGNLLQLEIFWGGALAFFAWLGAPWVAHLLVDPHPAMVGVLRWLTLYLFFEGLATVPRFYFDSELAVGRTVGPEILRNLCFVVLSIGLSLAGYGIWSLIAGHVAAAFLYAVLLWIRAWPSLPLAVEPGRMGALLRGSLPLAAIWFLMILTRYIDPLVLGRRFSLEVIGNFSFAFEWATLASVQILMPALGRALYPALIAYRDDTPALFRAYSLTTILVLAIEVPLALFFALNASWVVNLVGGGQWSQAPVFLTMLALSPLVDPFSRFGGEVLKVRHQDRLWILSSGATAFTFALGGYWLTGEMGPIGMAVIHFVPAGALWMAWGLYRVAPAAWRQLATDLLWVYLLPIPGFALVWLFAGDSPFWRVGLSLLAALLALLLVGWRFGGELLRFFRGRA